MQSHTLKTWRPGVMLRFMPLAGGWSVQVLKQVAAGGFIPADTYYDIPMYDHAVAIGRDMVERLEA